MPHQPIDYSSSVIYRIYNTNNPNDRYIGSTSNFSRRKARHRYNSKTPTASEYNYKLYQHIRQAGGWGCYTMDIIEQYVCETRKELMEREKYYIRNTPCNLNTHIYVR